jgi:hypothetical protein
VNDDVEGDEGETATTYYGDGDELLDDATDD